MDKDHLRLIAALSEQTEFLRMSAAAFDEGQFAEAKRLAVAVRTLCHDTRRSHSLLGQLGILDGLTLSTERQLRRQTSLVTTSSSMAMAFSM